MEDNRTINNMHIIYYSQPNTVNYAIKLLQFALVHFGRTSNFTEYNLFETLRFNINNQIPIKPKDFIVFADNKLIDDIRFGIAIENYLKAMLMYNGYLIHDIDRNIFIELYYKQRKTPIEYEEFVKVSQWTDDHTMHPKKVLKGLKHTTINFSIILLEKYRKKILGTDKFLNLFYEINKDRNKLHFHNQEELHLGKKYFDKIDLLIEFYNKALIGFMQHIYDNYPIEKEFELIPIKPFKN